jgi:c-di-GMP-binding flagellar brake protein YcgR
MTKAKISLCPKPTLKFIQRRQEIRLPSSRMVTLISEEDSIMVNFQAPVFQMCNFSPFSCTMMSMEALSRKLNLPLDLRSE